MHKARLTQKITKQRCIHLERQWDRSRLCNANDIIPVIKATLPAREHEIEPLKRSFEMYMRDSRDVIACERCGLLTSCWDYIGDDQVCMECYEEGRE